MTDKEEALELYKTYVDTITANEQRRQQLATFYLSLVAAGIALLGTKQGMEPLYVLIPVFVVASVWYATIRYFRQLAQAKFKVIDELESHFSIQPFKLEYKHYKKQKETTDQNERKSKLGLTHLDMIIPFLIAIVCGSYVVFRAVDSMLF